MAFWKLAAFTAILAAIAVPARASLQLQWSQDGVSYRPLAMVCRAQDAVDYYDPFEFSGHPQFGTAPGLASAAMFWDKNDHRLSLILVAGHDERQQVWGHSGKARFALEGLPSSTKLDWNDDRGSTYYHRGQPTASCDFRFTKESDGAVFGGLEDRAFLIKLALTAEQNVEAWRLVDGGVRHNLDFARPLYIRTAPDAVLPVKQPDFPPPPPATAPIPEPAAGAWLLLSGLFLRRMRGIGR